MRNFEPTKKYHSPFNAPTIFNRKVIYNDLNSDAVEIENVYGRDSIDARNVFLKDADSDFDVLFDNINFNDLYFD